MDKYTIKELKLAEELCSPETFRRLLQKQSEGTYYSDCWQSLDVSFRKTHKNSLLSLVFAYSRADYESELGAIFEHIINDLLGR